MWLSHPTVWLSHPTGWLSHPTVFLTHPTVWLSHPMPFPGHPTVWPGPSHGPEKPGVGGVESSDPTVFWGFIFVGWMADCPRFLVF